MAQTHTWASFSYSNLTIQTSFTGLTVLGPQNNSTLKVLTQVTLNDGSRFNFDYTSWGQVWKVSNYAADNHLLNYRSYNLRGSPMLPTGTEPDCPRFTERHDWAENWNRDPNGNAQEAVTYFVVPSSATIPGTSLTGTLTQVSLPDNTFQKIYFGSTSTTPAWENGLPLVTETYDSTPVKQRWVTTSWTQDDTTVAYYFNPRVTETNIFDPAGNRARTRIDYAAFNLADGTSCRYPADTYEYQADASTVLRRTHTDYNMDATYTNRRIIGLPSAKYLCDGAQGEIPCNDQSGASLFSKLTFQYDESGSIQGSDAPVQHDNTNYGSGFITGRGNLSSVKRYDVTNSGQPTVSTAQYNTTGAVVKTTDAAGHYSQISYADQFSADGTTMDSGRPLTLAYPTTVTDPDLYTAKSRYNYDFGAPTWRQTPLPNVTDNQPGPQQTIAYDSFGRLQRVTNLTNNAYTRYEYGPNFVQSYSTVNAVADEGYSLQVFDGAGRAIAKASNHPGSTGAFNGQLLVYDNMGRLVKQSNPTETSLSSISINAAVYPYGWAVAGDDAQVGWVYTQQTYDWKGRPLVTTNTDNTTKSASYSGCGCAGGEVVTLADEGTIDGGVAKRRQQKIYSDVLGRRWKTETLNWEGGSIYSTSVSVYNTRDQVTNIKQYAGAAPADASSTNATASCPSGTCQETLLTYDGYGRLKTRQNPEQQVDPNNSASADHTTLQYNDDDTIHSVKDARGVTSTFGYNARHLVTSITYPDAQSLPSGVSSASNVSFGYDAAGNRISMTDGLGSKSYSYNNLSRLTSETRTFTGVGTFTLSYDYNLGGELKKITDSTNMTINYGYDSAGRLLTVTGSDTLVAGVSNYASGFQYRAWSALKQISVGTHTSTLSYNSRLQPTNFNISGGVDNENYDYFADGRLSFAHKTTDSNFDRSFTYDHVGRLTAAASGGEARHDSGAVPMYETFQYNSWDDITARSSESWLNAFSEAGTYTNHRRAGWTYDASGRVVTIDTRTYGYDAAGQTTLLTGQRWTQDGYVPTTTTSDFDGDGNKIRETSDSLGSQTTTYYLRSSVLGNIVEELSSSGVKQIGYVYTPAGGLLAMQVPGNNYVMLKQLSPTGASEQEFFTSNVATGADIRREFDPVGAAVPLNDHTSLGHGGAPGDLPSGGGGPADSRFAAINNPAAGCVLDGVYTPCDWIDRLTESGALTLAVRFHGKETRLDLKDFGLGLYAIWREAQKGRSGNSSNDIDYSGDIAVARTNNRGDDTPGYWEFVSLDFGTPQNTYDPRADFRDYAKDLSNDRSQSDCLKLALLVYKAGQIWGNGDRDTHQLAGSIANGLLNGLTEWASVTGDAHSDPNYRVGVMRNDPNGNYAKSFGDTGFLPQFAYGTNEVRHFIAFFASGEALGLAGGYRAVRQYIPGSSTTDQKRIALGDIGVQIGVDLRFYGFRSAAQEIWHSVCGQNSDLNLL